MAIVGVPLVGTHAGGSEGNHKGCPYLIVTILADQALGIATVNLIEIGILGAGAAQESTVVGLARAILAADS